MGSEKVENKIFGASNSADDVPTLPSFLSATHFDASSDGGQNGDGTIKLGRDHVSRKILTALNPDFEAIVREATDRDLLHFACAPGAHISEIRIFLAHIVELCLLQEIVDTRAKSFPENLRVEVVNYARSCLQALKGEPFVLKGSKIVDGENTIWMGIPLLGKDDFKGQFVLIGGDGSRGRKEDEFFKRETAYLPFSTPLYWVRKGYFVFGESGELDFCWPEGGPINEAYFAQYKEGLFTKIRELSERGTDGVK